MRLHSYNLCASSDRSFLCLQSIADRVKLHGDRDTPPQAVKHVADAVRQLGISDKPEE